MRDLTEPQRIALVKATHLDGVIPRGVHGTTVQYLVKLGLVELDRVDQPRLTSNGWDEAAEIKEKICD